MLVLRRPAIVLGALAAAAACSTARVDTPAPATAPATLAWTEGPVLPRGRDHHATWITRARDGGAQLWVAGGTDYRGVFADVWRLPLAADGRPAGAWTEAGTLPARRAGQGVAVVGDVVVLAGGQDSTLRKMTDVWTARVQPDGTLGAWTPATALPAPRFHHALVHHRGWLYALGGLETNTSVTTGFRAPIANGVVGAWVPLPETPEPRSHQSSFVVGDTLFMVGGISGNPARGATALGSVIAATIGRDGSLGPWRAAGDIAPAVATHASAVAGGVVWTVGGVEDNARFSSSTWRAPAGGALPAGAWVRDSTGLPAASSHVHQMPVFAGTLYRVGGGARRAVTGNVLMARVE